MLIKPGPAISVFLRHQKDQHDLILFVQIHVDLNPSFLAAAMMPFAW